MTPKIKKFLAILIIHAVFCSLLMFYKTLTDGENSYLYMIFNLFLAWIPLIIILFIKRKRNLFVNLMLFIAVIIFLPNAGYVVTDLIHLKDVNQSFLWIDSLLLFNFAVNALFVGNLSLEIIFENILLPKLGSEVSWVITTFILYFTSVGIYMGRFLRLNSWDFLFQPKEVLSQTLERFTNPILHPVTVPFTLFITLTLLINFLFVRFLVNE